MSSESLEETCRRILETRPDCAEAHANLGALAARSRRFSEAEEHYRRAVRLSPGSATLHASLGNTLREQGRLEEALEQFQEAVRHDPESVQTQQGLGLILTDLGRTAEALACYDRALALRPDDPGSHWLRARVRLGLGDYSAWAEHEWRWRVPDVAPRSFPQPLWDGGALPDATLFLHGEQGSGDTIQFVRYVKRARKRARSTIQLGCREPLRRLLASCPGVDRLVSGDEPLSPFEAHAPLMSLPAILNTRLADVPADIPYLHSPAPGSVPDRRRKAAGSPGRLGIGIAWQSSNVYPTDILRSAPLEEFAPLALPDVRLSSLQVGPAAADLGSASFPLEDLGSTFADFGDTAAAMVRLDLVVTIDTAVAHLAGALGLPTWVALPFASDWRWLKDREDTPWYPSLRLFRQDRPGHWASVFAPMSAELVTILGNRS
jgi:hypothetical protein